MSTQTTWLTAGATSKTVDVQLVQKASATSPGDPLTALAFNTASLVAWYQLNNGTLTQITLVTQTVTGAYSSGGFVERSSANAPGGYRFDVPNACIATKGECNIWISGAANLAVHMLKIIVQAVDLYDSVRAGLTALPNVASGSGGAIPTTGTGANQINVTGGRVDANLLASGGYVFHTGTAQGGTASSITATAGATALQCQGGDKILLTGGTGAGQSAAASAAMDGTTKVIPIVGFWSGGVNPDTSTTYQVIKDGGGVPATIDDFWNDAESTNKHLNSAINLTSSAGSLQMDAAGNVLANLMGVNNQPWTGGTKPYTVST